MTEGRRSSFPTPLPWKYIQKRAEPLKPIAENQQQQHDIKSPRKTITTSDFMPSSPLNLHKRRFDSILNEDSKKQKSLPQHQYGVQSSSMKAKAITMVQDQQEAKFPQAEVESMSQISTYSSSVQTCTTDTTSTSVSQDVTQSIQKFNIDQFRQSLQKKRKSGAGRKSSFCLRGKRRSSYSNLQLSVHNDVPSTQFVNHIQPDLPDPIRMKQLLLYCISRIKDQQSDIQVSIVLQDIYQALLDGQINCSWYHRPRDPPRVVQRPNPLNEQLDREFQQLNEQINLTSEQIQQWSGIQLENYLDCELADENVDLFSIEKQMMDDLISDENVKLMLDDSANYKVCQDIENLEMKIESLLKDCDPKLMHAHDMITVLKEIKQHVDEMFVAAIEVVWPDEDEDLSTPPSQDGASQKVIPENKKRESGLRMTKDDARRASLLGLEVPSPNRLQRRDSSRQREVDPTVRILKQLANFTKNA
ncbi:hypothetical protein MP228_009578 [Amoeboaphelidium protococcarum]|nr:hypothetical protein MP228_009578 [Amoeboaphelidium protococcarum]